MSSAFEGFGQKSRAGLGFASQDAWAAAPPKSFAPAPDAQVHVDNAQPISRSDAEVWEIVQQVLPF